MEKELFQTREDLWKEIKVSSVCIICGSEFDKEELVCDDCKNAIIKLKNDMAALREKELKDIEDGKVTIHMIDDTLRLEEEEERLERLNKFIEETITYPYFSTNYDKKTWDKDKAWLEDIVKRARKKVVVVDSGESSITLTKPKN